MGFMNKQRKRNSSKPKTKKKKHSRQYCTFTALVTVVSVVSIVRLIITISFRDMSRLFTKANHLRYIFFVRRDANFNDDLGQFEIHSSLMYCTQKRANVTIPQVNFQFKLIALFFFLSSQYISYYYVGNRIANSMRIANVLTFREKKN